MRMIDEDEVGLKEKPEDTRKDYIKMRPEAPGVWAKDFPTLPLHVLGTADSGTAGSSLPGGPWEGVKSIPEAPEVWEN